MSKMVDLELRAGPPIDSTKPSSVVCLTRYTLERVFGRILWNTILVLAVALLWACVVLLGRERGTCQSLSGRQHHHA